MYLIWLAFYRNHPSNWWKLILVDNDQFSLTVPPNCCEKLDFLAILPPVIYFLNQSLSHFRYLMPQCHLQLLISYITRNIFDAFHEAFLIKLSHDLS